MINLAARWQLSQNSLGSVQESIRSTVGLTVLGLFFLSRWVATKRVRTR